MLETPYADCVAGALREDDFVRALEFTDEVIRLMRELIPAERQGEVAISVIFRARLPDG